MTVDSDRTGIIERIAGAADIQFLSTTLAAAQHPIAGTLVAGGFALINGANSRLQRISMARELAAISKAVDSLRDQVSASTLGDEQFAELVLRAVEGARRVRGTENLARIARVVAAASTLPVEKWGPLESVVDALCDLSDAEALLLGAILKGEAGRDWTEGTARGVLPTELQAATHFLLVRVARTGLISELTGARVGYGGGTFRLTNTGKELKEYLAPTETCDVSQWF